MGSEKSLESLLVLHEGLRLKPYRCTSGKLTIGVGRNLDDSGITREEAMFLFRNDIVKAKQDCRQAISFWAQLSPARKDALTDMCFNMGIARLLKFKKTLLAMEAQDWDTAAAGILASKYATQVGRRAERIAQMIKLDCYPWECGQAF